MRTPEIIILAAVAKKNRVIGKDGELPWYLPEDLKRFKQLTLSFPVIMGRKTFASILQRLGKPLPGRRNIVLSSSMTYPDYPDVEVYHSLNDALEAVKNEKQAIIAGGASLYAEGLDIADRLELTLVLGDYEGDAYFPEYESLLGTTFVLSARDVKDGYEFVSYVRK
jgi:dihydrofolate reductase